MKRFAGISISLSIREFVLLKNLWYYINKNGCYSISKNTFMYINTYGYRYININIGI